MDRPHHGSNRNHIFHTKIKMVWKQDSIKSQELMVKQPEGEGQAEVIEVYATHEGFVSPGQVVPVGGGMKNVGGHDNMMLVIGFTHEGAWVGEYISKTETQATDGEIWLSGELTIPSDFAGAKITLVAVGFHEE